MTCMIMINAEFNITDDAAVALHSSVAAETSSTGTDFSHLEYPDMSDSSQSEIESSDTDTGEKGSYLDFFIR